MKAHASTISVIPPKGGIQLKVCGVQVDGRRLMIDDDVAASLKTFNWIPPFGGMTIICVEGALQ